MNDLTFKQRSEGSLHIICQMALTFKAFKLCQLEFLKRVAERNERVREEERERLIAENIRK